MAPPTVDEIRPFPKVLLHDHLDGGLRLSTWRELASKAGLDTAHIAPVAPAAPSLEGYLALFASAVAVMQDAPSLRRTAREAVEDLAADGVVYAELRFAPELHTQAGMNPAAAVEAVLEGVREAVAGTVGAGGHRIDVSLLLTAMRTSPRSAASATARLAAGYRNDGVAGFDLAGLEPGHLASEHLEAIAIARSGGAAVTVHAGEAGDLSSVQDAVFACGAQRIGHGVRLVDDITERPGADPELGPTATYMKQRRLTLEMCPTSNRHTGAVPAGDVHPAGRLLRYGLSVTINTDNRSMSGVTLSSELAACTRDLGWGWDEIRLVTTNAIEGAFCPPRVKETLRALVAAAP